MQPNSIKFLGNVKQSNMKQNTSVSTRNFSLEFCTVPECLIFSNGMRMEIPKLLSHRYMWAHGRERKIGIA